MSKTILITGSTDGIGKQTAIEFAKHGESVIIHGGNEKRVGDTLSEIRNLVPGAQLSGYTADLSSLKQTLAFSEQLNRDFQKIDILFNNAAVFAHEFEQTEDGYELCFQVNHLSHNLLTLKVMNLLQAGTESRVVNVSSMIHAASIDFDKLQTAEKYNGSQTYALTKLCNILFTNKLEREFGGKGVRFYALHPGVIETKLLNSAWSGGMPVSEGAKNMIYAGTAPALATLSGVYVESGRPVQSNPITYNTEAQDTLWNMSLDMLKNYL